MRVLRVPASAPRGVCDVRAYDTAPRLAGRGRGSIMLDGMPQPAGRSVCSVARRTVRAPCPRCDRGPRDTALAVTIDERGTVSYCHRGGYTAHEPHRGPAPIVTSSEPLEWSPRAQAIWDRTLPLRGSLGEVYLRHRGCALPPADGDLRYLPPTDRHPPTLCARVTDARTAAPLSLHFTRLAADGRGKAGTERDKLLLGRHRKRGGVIRLWPDEAVTHGLVVAEGIESALAAAHVYTPVWAAIDASNLAALPVLAGIETLVIVADHDPAGIRAARECAHRWATAGCDARIALPPTPGADAADLGVAA